MLAAKRAGIKDIILSEENRKDVEDIRKDYIKDLRFHYVSDMMDVVRYALLKEKVRDALDIRFEDNGQEKKEGERFLTESQSVESPGVSYDSGAFYFHQCMKSTCTVSIPIRCNSMSFFRFQREIADDFPHIVVDEVAVRTINRQYGVGFDLIQQLRDLDLVQECDIRIQRDVHMVGFMPLGAFKTKFRLEIILHDKINGQ